MNIVPPEQLANVWPEVVAWISQAVAVNQGDENTLDVLIALAQGRYTLWHEPGVFAAVSSIVRYPRQTVGNIVYLGGADLESIQRAFGEAKAYARRNGIDVLRVWGRPGWERLLALKRRAVILQIEV